MSFIVLSYNQDKYIKEAIEGAISQLYRPLEIILSDDSSTDGTYQSIVEASTKHSGDAKLIVNRTRKNVGLTTHLNEVIKIANGQLIVVAAGDDISVPERTSDLVERWSKSGYSSGSIFSGFEAIEENGKPIRISGTEEFRTDESWLKIQDQDYNVFGSYPGCTHAFTPDTFRIFGDISKEIFQEDIVIQLRSALVGGVGFVNKPLVKYRMTASSVSRNGVGGSRFRMEKAARYNMSFSRVWDSFCRDCELAFSKGLLNEPQKAWAIKNARAKQEFYKAEADFFSGKWPEKLRLCLNTKLSLKGRLRRLIYTLFPFLYGYGSKVRNG